MCSSCGEWGNEQSPEQDTPPGTAARTQNPNNAVIERSFPAALCVHSAFLTALGELHLHRLFPRGLQGKCHENMVIDLSKDEPRETRRKGGRGILKTSSFIFPEKGGEGFPDLCVLHEEGCATSLSSRKSFPRLYFFSLWTHNEMPGMLEGI